MLVCQLLTAIHPRWIRKLIIFSLVYQTKSPSACLFLPQSYDPLKMHGYDSDLFKDDKQMPGSSHVCQTQRIERRRGHMHEITVVTHACVFSVIAAVSQGQLGGPTAIQRPEGLFSSCTNFY